MVVVDNARRMIGKNADIAVTSVLQTTAGKMIFGRLWEDAENGAQGEPRAASAGNQRRPFQHREQRPSQPAPVRHSESVEQ
jgi:hypothetical protein